MSSKTILHLQGKLIISLLPLDSLSEVWKQQQLGHPMRFLLEPLSKSVSSSWVRPSPAAPKRSVQEIEPSKMIYSSSSLVENMLLLRQ